MEHYYHHQYPLSPAPAPGPPPTPPPRPLSFDAGAAARQRLSPVGRWSPQVAARLLNMPGLSLTDAELRAAHAVTAVERQQDQRKAIASVRDLPSQWAAEVQKLQQLQVQLALQQAASVAATAEHSPSSATSPLRSTSPVWDRHDRSVVARPRPKSSPAKAVTSPPAVVPHLSSPSPVAPQTPLPAQTPVPPEAVLPMLVDTPEPLATHSDQASVVSIESPLMSPGFAPARSTIPALTRVSLTGETDDSGPTRSRGPRVSRHRFSGTSTAWQQPVNDSAAAVAANVPIRLSPMEPELGSITPAPATRDTPSNGTTSSADAESALPSPSRDINFRMHLDVSDSEGTSDADDSQADSESTRTLSTRTTSFSFPMRSSVVSEEEKAAASTFRFRRKSISGLPMSPEHRSAVPVLSPRGRSESFASLERTASMQSLPREGHSVVSFLQSVPAFHTLKFSQLEQLARLAVQQSFEAGVTIVEQGKECTSVYIIEEGTVVVLQTEISAAGGAAPTFTLTVGDHFGEHGLVKGGVRRNSCVARTKVACLVVSADSFRQVLSSEGTLLPENESQHVHEPISSLDSYLDTVESVLNKYPDPADAAGLLLLTSDFVPELPLHFLADTVMVALTQVMTCSHVGLLFCQAYGGTVRCHAKVVGSPIQKFDLQGVASECYRTGEPILFQPTSAAEEDAGLRDWFGVKVVSALAVPIIASDKIGVAVLVQTSSAGISAADVHAVAAVLTPAASLFEDKMLVLADVPVTTDAGDISDPYVLRAEYLDAPPGLWNSSTLSIQAKLIFGNTALTSPAELSQQRISRVVRDGITYSHCSLNAPLAFDLTVRNIPLGTRVQFIVRNSSGKAVGWAACTAYTEDHKLRQGPMKIPLWGEAPPNVLQPAMVPSPITADTPVLWVSFPDFGGPVFYAKQWPSPPQLPTGMSRDTLPPSVQEVMRKPLLGALEPGSKSLIWAHRWQLVSQGAALPKVVASCDWARRECVMELHSLLPMWGEIGMTEALELLNEGVQDPMVRAYAASFFARVDDDGVLLFMLQFVQVLRFEAFGDSAVARHVMVRALLNRSDIGNDWYWFAKTEVGHAGVGTRFRALLACYLRHCGQHRIHLGHQSYVMSRLEEVASQIKEVKVRGERNREARKLLAKIIFPERFQLPVCPAFEAKGLVIEQCRVMSSKKLPMFLCFEKANGCPYPSETYRVLFKIGDDLRQDQLTLQVLRVMAGLWASEGMDMCMSPYRCIATSNTVGMLEIVDNSATIGGVILSSLPPNLSSTVRKSQAASAVFRPDTIARWLWQHNTKTSGPGSYSYAQQKFARSCAGYCIATYVLGIGDRHCDNVMVTHDGGLFHVDFGHFLGNFKSKLGIRRERVPFVFTPAYAQVLDGPQGQAFKGFSTLACRGLCLLMRHTQLVVTLFKCMLGCQLPELKVVEDLKWLVDHLPSDRTDEQISLDFAALIEFCLQNKSTLANDAAHLLKHA